jgi:hypothetical protein
MSGFSREQVDQLLRAINGKRVSTDGKGYSHVEAYDIRAHLTRIFGFGNWDTEVTMLEQVYESSEMKRKRNKQGEEYGDPYEAWTVCYRARMRLTVRSQDGTVCSTHEDGATGEATNQPSRGDAHDLALKTACSQALKRAAVNWGDNFGLSLYAKGSKAALIRRTLVMPDAEAAADGEAVDSHITEPLPREDELPEPENDQRETNVKKPPPAPPVADEPDPDVDPAEREALRKQVDADRIRQAAIDPPPEDWAGTPVRWISHLMGEAVKHKIQNVPVESLLSPNPVALRVMLEQRMKLLADEQRVAS